jgi:O-antigen/teichoic acid export membrane protein
MTAAQNVKRQIRLGLFVMPAGLGLQFLAFMLIASHLGPRDFGVFSVIFAIMNIASFATEMGMGTIITKFVAAGKEEPREHIAVALPGISVVAVLTSVVQLVVIFSFFSIAETGVAALLACLNVLLFANSIVLSCTLRGLGRMEQWYAGFFLQKVVAVALVFAVVRPLGGGVTWSVAVWPISNFVLLIYYLICVWGDVWRGQLRWSFPELKLLMRESIPVGLISAAYRVSTQLETFFLTGMSGPSAAGLYAVGQRLLNPSGSVLHGAVITPTFPGLCRQIEDRTAFEQRVTQLVKVNWVASLAIAMAIWAAAPLAVPLALGDKFNASVPVIQIVVWALAPSLVSLQLRYAFVALSRQGIFLRLSVAYLLLKAGLIFVLTARFGISGACWGTVAAESLLALMVWLGLRSLGVRLRVAPALALSTASALAVVWLASRIGLTHWLSLASVVGYVIASMLLFLRLLRRTVGRPRTVAEA